MIKQEAINSLGEKQLVYYPEVKDVVRDYSGTKVGPAHLNLTGGIEYDLLESTDKTVQGLSTETVNDKLYATTKTLASKTYADEFSATSENDDTWPIADVPEFPIQPTEPGKYLLQSEVDAIGDTGVMSWQLRQPDKWPNPPGTDGVYIPKATVVSGTATYGYGIFGANLVSAIPASMPLGALYAVQDANGVASVQIAITETTTATLWTRA
jgi:hypothetical protein